MDVVELSVEVVLLELVVDELVVVVVELEVIIVVDKVVLVELSTEVVVLELVVEVEEAGMVLLVLVDVVLVVVVVVGGKYNPFCCPGVPPREMLSAQLLTLFFPDGVDFSSVFPLPFAPHEELYVTPSMVTPFHSKVIVSPALFNPPQMVLEFTCNASEFPILKLL